MADRTIAVTTVAEVVKAFATLLPELAASGAVDDVTGTFVDRTNVDGGEDDDEASFPVRRTSADVIETDTSTGLFIRRTSDDRGEDDTDAGFPTRRANADEAEALDEIGRPVLFDVEVRGEEDACREMPTRRDMTRLTDTLASRAVLRTRVPVTLAEVLAIFNPRRTSDAGGVVLLCETTKVLRLGAAMGEVESGVKPRTILPLPFA